MRCGELVRAAVCLLALVGWALVAVLLAGE